MFCLVDVFRQFQRTRECAALALAGQGQNIFLDDDFDLIGFEAGDGDFDLEARVGSDDVDLRVNVGPTRSR